MGGGASIPAPVTATVAVQKNQNFGIEFYVIKSDNDKNYIEWRGYKVDKTRYKIRFAYERLERNKSKYLLSIFEDDNYFFRNVRFKSQKFIRTNLNKYTNTCAVDYHKIGNETVGFHYKNPENVNINYSTYIFKNKKVLDKISKIIFIPTKEEVYFKYLKKNNEVLSKKKYELLKTEYQRLGINVYDLTEVLQNNTTKMLIDKKYLFWKDDTHWNKNGITISMEHIYNNLIK